MTKRSSGSRSGPWLQCKKSALTLGLFFLLFGWAPKANAQAAIFVLLFGDKVASETFHLSLDAGAGLSDLVGIEGGDLTPGFSFGMGGHLKISDRWSFVPEFKPLGLRGLRGVHSPIALPPEYAGSSPKSGLRMNYLDVPLLMQFRITDKIYVSAGPQISFLLSANQATAVTLSSGSAVTVDQDVKSQLNGYDVSAPVEIGYMLLGARNGKSIHLRLRYTYGFLNIFTSGGSAHTSVFQLLLTLPFVNLPEAGPEAAPAAAKPADAPPAPPAP